MNIESVSGYMLQVSEEEARVIKTGLIALNWGDFPLAEKISDQFTFTDIEAYDVDGEVGKL